MYGFNDNQVDHQNYKETSIRSGTFENIHNEAEKQHDGQAQKHSAYQTDPVHISDDEGKTGKIGAVEAGRNKVGWYIVHEREISIIEAFYQTVHVHLH